MVRHAIKNAGNPSTPDPARADQAGCSAGIKGTLSDNISGKGVLAFDDQVQLRMAVAVAN